MRAACAWLVTVSLALGWAAPAGAEGEAKETDEAPAVPEGPVVPPSLVTFAEAELPPGTPWVDGDVVLRLTIEADGAVTDVVVTSGLGGPYDAAAVAAAKRMVFRAATAGGAPIAVTVPFTFEFAVPRRRGLMVETRRGRGEREVLPGGVYVGEVREMGTRTPLAGVWVVATDERTGATFETVTDGDGRFVLEGLPPWPVSVEASPGDDVRKRKKPREVTGVVRPEGAPLPELDEDAGPIYVLPSTFADYTTRVKEPKRKEAASVISLQNEELTRVPGTFGDPTRVIATLPGVARSPFGLGYFVVRGASFENTGFLIDGHPAGYLYHLGGGPSVLHPALVDTIDFYPAGYPASYGRFAGGLIAIGQRENPDDRWHLDLEMDLLKATVLFSVPFDEGKGMVTLSFRRSYFEPFLLLVEAVNPEFGGVIFNYTDYQARVRYDVTPELRWSFYVFGAEDQLGLSGAGLAELGFHRVRTAFDYRPSKTFQWETSAVFEWFHTNASEVAEDAEGFGLDLENWFVQLRSVARVKLVDELNLQVGVDALYGDFTAGLSIEAPTVVGGVPGQDLDLPFTDFSLNDDLVSVAPFFVLDWEPIEGLRILPSARLNIELYGDGPRITADPKLAVRADVHEMVTLKATGALAHQAPSPITTAPPFGNPRLPPARAWQASAGLEVRPAEGWDISAEGFYNHFEDLVQGDQGVSQLDQTLFAAGLEGRSYGLEVIVRKAFGDWIHGWLSYTLSRTERRSYPGGPWVLFGLDQTHILNLAWTVQLPGEISIGARFQLTSGTPYAPVVDAKYDADADEYVPRTGPARSGRLPLFHRLDLRIDKRIRYETYMLEIYLDIQNVYNQTNPEALEYSYDYLRSRPGLGLPILPTLGFRLVF